MSGGVDSSVAALRLVRAGFDVIGVTLHLWDYPPRAVDAKARCCAPEDQHDARRVADMLEVPHYVFDRRELFRHEVVDPFVAAYLGGRTPSPCNDCNRTVKLAELFRLADLFGARHVATGHYARTVQDSSGKRRIARGVDGRKDQSYFLHATTQTQIDRLLFPLGSSFKEEVRTEALAAKLVGAGKGESQELCFIGAGDGAYAAFVESEAPGRVRPGPIVDESGRVLGSHSGIHRFTVGQRRGLGIATGQAAFVSRVDAHTGAVHVSSAKEPTGRVAFLEDFLPSEGIALPLDGVRVRVRYRHDGALARVDLHESGVRVQFDEPTRALTPGQIAVLYEGDCVVGGGRIAATDAPEPRGA